MRTQQPVGLGLWLARQTARTLRSCCAPFRETVLAHARAKYLAGRTPNLCVVCNQSIKPGVLPGLRARAGLKFDP